MVRRGRMAAAALAAVGLTATALVPIPAAADGRRTIVIVE